MTVSNQGSLEFRIKEVWVAKRLEDSDPRTLVFTEITNISGRDLFLDLHFPTILAAEKKVKADTWLEENFQFGTLPRGGAVVAVFGFDPESIPTFQYGDTIVFRWSQDSEPLILESEFIVTEENTCKLQSLEAIENRMKCMAFLKDGFDSMESEDYSVSVGFFTKALEYDPGNPVAIGHRGLSQSYLENHEEAIQDFTQALALNGAELGWYLYRGISLFHLGRKAEARQDLEKYPKDAEVDEESRETAEDYLRKCT